MMVGRRKKDRHLPARCYWHHGAVWWVEPGTEKWHRLADNEPDALVAYARLLRTGMPTETVAALWARYQAEEMDGLAPRTRTARGHDMKVVLRVFGHMAPRAVKPSDVWGFWTEAGRNEQARHMIRTFSAVLSAGVRWGALDRNPCFGLRLPGGTPRDRYVTDDEYLQVRDLAPEMIGLAMDLALLTGARQGDVLRLDRDSETETGLAFRAGKTGRAQVIEWNDELRATVAACWRVEPRVRRTLICTRAGRPFASSGFQTAWQRLMERAEDAGLAERFTFHDLRAKSLSDAGSLSEAAARGGHADPRVTDRVYRRLPKRAPALSIFATKSGS